MRTLYYLFRSFRAVQWIKNGFILIPLLFARKVFYFDSLLLSFQTVCVFCLLCSAIYLINDVFDMEADRRHPTKKNRPLASGLVARNLVAVTATIFVATSLIWSYFLSGGLLIIVLIYLFIQFLYNYRLKETPILDVFCVSSGFFLRVAAGAEIIHVQMSHWLIICSVLISIFLTIGKRRQELVALGEAEAGNHRRVLSEYSPQLLDQMIAVITGGVLLSYMLYCVAPETIEKFRTDKMVYTFPLVLYGIFRYLYLIHQKNGGGAPEKLLLSDAPLLVCVIFWASLCVSIIYGVV